MRDKIRNLMPSLHRCSNNKEARQSPSLNLMNQFHDDKSPFQDRWRDDTRII